MYAVGRLGSIISRGVYTVSAPFHPFGGAVDIIVVEQPDGSFKSSPWYVRFGKFQGVLKSKEKIVRIRVNDVDSSFHMYLDHKGEAHFLREAVFEDGETVQYPSSSSDETDERSDSKRRPLESISCNCDAAGDLNSADQIDTVTSKKIIPRTNSNRERRIFGLVFGRKSMKGSSGKEEEVGPGVIRTNSFERAELAADLLEVKWSTNLASSRSIKDKSSKQSGCEISENSFGRDTVSAIEKVASTSGESFLKDECGVTFGIPGVNGGNDAQSANFENAKSFNIDYPEKQFYIEEVASTRDALKDRGLPDEETVCANCEASPSSVLDVSCEEIHQRLSISSGEHGEVDIHAETVFTTLGPLSEDMAVNQAEEMELNVEETLKIPDSCTQTVSLAMPGSVKEVKSSCTSPSSDSVTQIQVENENDLHHPLDSVSDPQKISSESVITKIFPPSETSEEAQFLFSDLDESKHKEQFSLNEEPQSSIDKIGEEVNRLVDINNHSFSSLEKCLPENLSNDAQNLSEKSGRTSDPISIQSNWVGGEKDCWHVGSLPNMWSPDDKLSLHNTCFLSHSLDVNAEFMGRMSLGDDLNQTQACEIEELQLPNDKSDLEDANAVEKSSEENPSKLTKTSSGSWKLWPFSSKGSNPNKQIAQEEAGILAANDDVERPVGRLEGQEDDQGKQLAQDGADNLANEKADDQGKQLAQDGADILANEKADDQGKQLAQDGANILANEKADNNKKACKNEKVKKMAKAMTPTSEQLASLNLKDGCNSVTFTFSTAMLGEQQVNARIFLWKWNTRIVISDVDGTITKSDVLGQFMPLVGRDWSQTGVAHFFSAIKENGYELLFLSARSITQAYLTRQFLVNLKQDGKFLPEGPVVISPDGLFPSLFREVIRRAPHEFKIACLEDIKALFPPDSSPFYAGFGNRDTDEFSYLKVGIPKGKIFIINPKGEVAVHRRLATKSYTSLHSLVHGMFPTRVSSEQEDFNSWNYWKLPPPEIK